MISKRNSIPALLFIVLVSSFGYGQIFDFSKSDPYKNVFVETDDFGISYLQILEDELIKIENNTLKFAVLNDLPNYWHTRNLTTA